MKYDKIKPKSFKKETLFAKVSFLLIASFLKKIYILAIGYEIFNKRKSGEPMDRNEFIKTLTILKTQPKENKGFSFRRTIKTLNQAKQNKPINDYYDHLIKAKAGVDKDE